MIVDFGFSYTDIKVILTNLLTSLESVPYCVFRDVSAGAT